MVLLVKSIKLLQKELFIIFLYNGKLYIEKHKILLELNFVLLPYWHAVKQWTHQRLGDNEEKMNRFLLKLSQRW